MSHSVCGASPLSSSRVHKYVARGQPSAAANVVNSGVTSTAGGWIDVLRSDAFVRLAVSANSESWFVLMS